MDTKFRNAPIPYTVIHLKLDSGERLPCLVDHETWIPARVATRWAVRYRRYRVQSSTLANNLRTLRQVYNWAETVGNLNLDDFLTTGSILDARQIESLAFYLRTGGEATKEPSVKTAERVIPASRRLLMAFRAYLTAPQPQGRVSGKSPYVFVTSAGEPVSLDAANDIIQSISRLSGVSLSWHSLRHTWAERMADLLADKPNGADQLKYLGGWTNSQSPNRYIQNAIAKQAAATLRKHQEEIYNLGERQDESTDAAISI